MQGCPRKVNLYYFSFLARSAIAPKKDEYNALINCTCSFICIQLIALVIYPEGLVLLIWEHNTQNASQVINAYKIPGV